MVFRRDMLSFQILIFIVLCVQQAALARIDRRSFSPANLLKIEPTNATSVKAVSWSAFSRKLKFITRTSKFSEENSGYSGRQTAPIAGIECSGSYCDNKRLVVVREGTSKPVLDSRYWTSWISEEKPSSTNCPSDMIVNEIQCSGKFCDNLRLQCGRLASDYRVITSNIQVVDWFSEEQGERLCNDGYYLWGIECRGSYCDDLKLKCARVEYSSVVASNVYLSVSAQYAPVYYFDGQAASYCLPDWPKSENNNKCRTSFLTF